MVPKQDSAFGRRRRLASWGLLVAPELGVVALALAFVLLFALF